MLEELLDAIKTLSDWPERVRLMQHNWIGRSEAHSSNFSTDKINGFTDIEVFTTRPDTLLEHHF